MSGIERMTTTIDVVTRSLVLSFLSIENTLRKTCRDAGWREREIKTENQRERIRRYPSQRMTKPTNDMKYTPLIVRRTSGVNDRIDHVDIR